MLSLICESVCLWFNVASVCVGLDVYVSVHVCVQIHVGGCIMCKCLGECMCVLGRSGGGGGGRRPPAHEASVPTPQGPRK